MYKCARCFGPLRTGEFGIVDMERLNPGWRYLACNSWSSYNAYMDYLQGTSGRLTPEMIDDVLKVVQDAFRQVRPYILERAGKSEYTSKQDGSPVTDADVEVEKTLQAALAQHFPGMPVFGEEAGYGNDLPGAFWLLDPIDGTQSFIEGVPSFTNMAVLIQDGEALASVIYNVAKDDMYVAQKGKGAYKNGVCLDLRTAPLAHIAYCKDRFADVLSDMLKAKEVTCQSGPQGGGFGFTMVADGQSAARFNLLGGGYVHDYAPGALLVREAGGVLIPIQEDTYTYTTRSFIACHPALESTLRPHVQKIRALEIEMKDK